MWGLHGISAELSALTCGLGGPEQWLLGQELPWLPGLVRLARGGGSTYAQCLTRGWLLVPGGAAAPG